MSSKKIGLLIGRFQPIHIGHIELIKHALSNCDKLIIVIGSDSTERTERNPFLTRERIDMIKMCFTIDELSRIILCPLKDYFDNTKWSHAVNEIVNDNSNSKHNDNEIILFGFDKDNSTYYLSLFPLYKQMLVESSYGSINGTDIRKKLFEHKIIDESVLHPEVSKYLTKFISYFI